MNENKLFLQNGYALLPEHFEMFKMNEDDFVIKELDSVATILSNMASYGYAPSKSLFMSIGIMKYDTLISFWAELEPLLKELTGADKNIDSHILYKNFPKEVLEMSHVEYWVRQAFVYFGLPYSFVAQNEEKRDSIYNELPLKVINGVEYNEKESFVKKIAKNLIGSTKRWSNTQSEEATFIFNESNEKLSFCDLEDYGFKENGLSLMVEMYKKEPKKIVEETDEPLGEFKNRISPEQYEILLKFATKSLKNSGAPVIPKESPLSKLKIKDATDVLRLASGLSGNGIRVNKKVTLMNFTRPERRALLSMLEESNNLEKDMSSRKEAFKRLLHALRPGDYKNKFPKCVEAYDKLYNNKLKSENSFIEKKIIEKDVSVIETLKYRPGIFVKKFHKLYEVFGENAVDAMKDIVPVLSTLQLVQFKKYILTINDRESLLYAPNGAWQKVQQKSNEKCKLENMHNLIKEIDTEIHSRLKEFYPEGLALDSEMHKVKMQTNDQKLAVYGRGTVFDIPENIKFVRTSSYWDINQGAFLDNTWNFFDENWKSMGVCCWDYESFSVLGKGSQREANSEEKAAVFSGDAINNEDGKAAQLIDLYLDKLEEQGVRYAVWSALSFSNIPFTDFNDAHAGMQLGEDPESGKTFEASRVNFSFPLSEKEKTKIIAYLDIKERKIIYCDVNKSMVIQSGGRNAELLGEFMPAYIEYMETVPSYQDVFGLYEKETGIPMLYSDKNVTFENEVPKAFVFKKENTENSYAEDLINFNDFMSFKRDKEK